MIVADGSEAAARRLQRVLTTDPGMGVVRHMDAGYPEAIAFASMHPRGPRHGPAHFAQTDHETVGLSKVDGVGLWVDQAGTATSLAVPYPANTSAWATKPSRIPKPPSQKLGSVKSTPKGATMACGQSEPPLDSISI